MTKTRETKLDAFKKDLGKILESLGWGITFHQGPRTKEASFLVKMDEEKGYVFRIDKGGLNIIYPESINPSSGIHERVIKIAKKHFKSIDMSQYEINIFKLLRFYQT